MINLLKEQRGDNLSVQASHYITWLCSINLTRCCQDLFGLGAQPSRLQPFALRAYGQARRLRSSPQRVLSLTLQSTATPQALHFSVLHDVHQTLEKSLHNPWTSN